MSFDLFFVSEKKKAIDLEGVAEYIANLPNMENESFYHNSNTGVYFILEFAQPMNGDESIPLPDNFQDIGLVFNINYNRPSFFAAEAMPIIEKLTKDLNLLIADPQSQVVAESLLPKEVNAEDLYESWRINNRKSLTVFKEHGDLPPYLSRDKSQYWWNYQFHYHQMNNEINRNIFVPNIFLMKKPDENHVITAITWTDGIPFLFPDCDIVIFVHLEKKGFIRKTTKPEIKGVLPAKQVRRLIGMSLQEIKTPIGSLPVLGPDESKKIRNTYFDISSDLASNVYERIAPDSMIDENID